LQRKPGTKEKKLTSWILKLFIINHLSGRNTGVQVGKTFLTRSGVDFPQMASRIQGFHHVKIACFARGKTGDFDI
jgi:hypothetical protein